MSDEDLGLADRGYGKGRYLKEQLLKRQRREALVTDMGVLYGYLSLTYYRNTKLDPGEFNDAVARINRVQAYLRETE